MHRIIGFALVCGLAGVASSARAAPMFTKLSTVRAKSAIVVVGVVSRHKAPGLVFDVEYTLRGKLAAGVTAFRESPDGVVFLPANKPARVVAFIDAQDRLRWMGQLIAGPDLERGVIRIHGFFNFNAHHVGPGVMTLQQLRDYLKTGHLRQRFRGALTFPDGKGGFRRTGHQITIDYAPLSRKTNAKGLGGKCLAHPNLSLTSWGSFRLLYYCRARNRSLALSGKMTGVDKSGAIEVDLIPSAPVLYAREFTRYIGDPSLTGVERSFRVSLPGGPSWTWIPNKGLVDRGGRLRRLRTMSASSTQAGRPTYTYRFGNITVMFFDQQSPYGLPMSLLQRADGGRQCALAVGKSKLRPCRVQRLPPRWKR